MNSPLLPLRKIRMLLPVAAAFCLLVLLFLNLRANRDALTPSDPAAQHRLYVEARTILAHQCQSCHGEVKAKGGLRLHTREALLEGGDEGPVVLPENPGRSELIRRISLPHYHKDVMPADGERLRPEEVKIIRQWVATGAYWPDGEAVSLYRIAPFENRLPVLPPSRKGLEQPIDRLTDTYFRRHRIPWRHPVDDRIFLRRAYLDILGLLPSPAQQAAFLVGTGEEKRDRLLRKLLDQDTAYARHWLSFWNDLLRNDYTGTGYITGGRKEITPWLYGSLSANTPYDSMVYRLISPDAATAGFLQGIQWRGTVNASQRVEMQAAQNVAQVFLGLNLKCASCHNSFISDWKLEDAYGFANLFAEAPLEIHRCDQPTGKLATNRLLFAPLGTLSDTLGREERLRELATRLTLEKHGRLARTFVNRIWAKLMGRGIVEPLDAMDNEPWDQDLLDWLAYDFTRSGYDIKSLLYQIMRSRTYQMPSVSYDGPDELVSPDYHFTGMVRRRLSAEQFADAISQAFYPMYGESSLASKHFPGLPRGGGIRASMVPNDPFLMALGRPTREHVAAVRPTQSNLLQALEVTNGEWLHSRLQAGARKWYGRGMDKTVLMDSLFTRFLGRLPGSREQRGILPMLPNKPRPADIQDLVWAIVLLPEFQLIH